MKMNNKHNPKPRDGKLHTHPKGTKILGLLNNPPLIAIPVLCYWIENGKQ